MKQDITCIIGPTGIGKTSFSIDLACTLNAEIISADAYQIYRGMTIGTGKITPDESRGIPHHLIDIKNPDESYSVSEFLNLTKELIHNLRTQNKSIIIVGGTALFMKAFLYNYIFPEAKSDPTIRNELISRLNSEGNNVLWNELQTIDPKTALIIHPNNRNHLLRALEIYKITGKKPSDLKQRSSTPRLDAHIIGLKAPKDVVDTRINLRVDKMIEKGLVQEVNNLLKKGYSKNLQSLQCLGYKEVIDYLKGSINHSEMVDLIKKNTRIFAKQQMTWFKKFENVNWNIVS